MNTATQTSSWSFWSAAFRDKAAANPQRVSPARAKGPSPASFRRREGPHILLPGGISAGSTRHPRRFSSVSGRFAVTAPTVGHVSISGQSPQVATPFSSAHRRMPQRFSQNTVFAPAARQP